MNNSYYLFAKSNKKRKYSIVGNFIFLLREMWHFDKLVFLSVFILAIPSIGSDYIGNLMPAAIVSKLEDGQSLEKILLSVLGLGVLLVVMTVLSSVFRNIEDYVSYYYWDLYLTKRFIKKNAEIDYQLKEAKLYQETYSNAWNSANSGRGFTEGTEITRGLLDSLIAIGLYGFIIGKRSLVILFLVFLSVGMNLYLLSVARKVHRKYYGKISKYAKGIGYISEVTMDSAAGKDIRIYRMLDFILKKYDENMEQIVAHYGKIHNWYMVRNVSGAVLSFIRDAVAYMYLAYLLYHGTISVAEFVFLIGAISSLAYKFEIMLKMLMAWNTLDSSVTYFRDYLSTKSNWKEHSDISKEELMKLKKGGLEVELKDVSYTYEGANKPTISHFNLKIKQGEKLALIGLNGAGKTTLVKLIAGLYFPDKGTITINGYDRGMFSREDYYELMAVMFQDAYFLPVALDENLTGGEAIDDDRLQKALKLSGFLQAYEKLENRGQSRLIKKLEDNAVDFSGGEKQKLIFARAIYKGAPFVILDEPTAALDPIAEHELYCNFKEAVGDSTCLYISHRLSSTRFCDRIVMIEDGNIIEEGTHEGLLLKNGRYAKLFEMQGKYYQEEQEHKIRLAHMEEGGAVYE